MLSSLITQNIEVITGIGWEKLKDQCSISYLQGRWAIRNRKSSTSLNQSQFKNHCLSSTVGMDFFFFPERDFSSLSQVGYGLVSHFSREPLFQAASNASSFLNEFQLQEISVLEELQ